METISLYRFKFFRTCTFGFLHTGKSLLFILELPWRENQRNVSCIPNGTYECKYLESSVSGKYKKIYHVKNVPNRTGILIHSGNTHDHTYGCLLPGLKIGKLGSKKAVLSSRTAMNRLLEDMNQESFKLEVKSWLSY